MDVHALTMAALFVGNFNVLNSPKLPVEGT